MLNLVEQDHLETNEEPRMGPLGGQPSASGRAAAVRARKNLPARSLKASGVKATASPGAQACSEDPQRPAHGAFGDVYPMISEHCRVWNLS